MKQTYVFDTSSLIRAWHEVYPLDVLPSFWKRLDEAMDGELVVCPDEVLLETSKRSDDLHKWLKTREHSIIPIDDAIQDAAAALLLKNPRMAMNRKGASSADVWVVATAQVHGGVVVSEETLADSQKRPKIPGVCKTEGITCENLLAFMRAQRWKI